MTGGDEELEHLARLAVDAVAAAAAGEPPRDPGDDPVARRVAHVVDAIAGARGDAHQP